MNDSPQPLKANSIAEEYDYISSLRCNKCGGAYQVMRQSLLFNDGTPMDAMDLECQSCKHEKHILFDISSFFGKD